MEEKVLEGAASSPVTAKLVRIVYRLDAKTAHLTILQNAIPKSVLARVLADFEVRHDVHMTPGQTKLFRNFQPDPLRAQVPIAIDGPVADPALFAPAPVIGLARRLLGDKLIIGEMGLVASHPGTRAQATHRDSHFLFGGVDEEIDLPPFAVTVLIPLIDVPLELGPTEVWLGSHKVRDESVVTATPPLQLPISAGSVLMLDSRIVHRGGANVGSTVRPVVYFSYHRPWYLEAYGYENKPQICITPAALQRLPEPYRALFEWGLHLNRMGKLDEVIFRWAGRLRRGLLHRFRR